MRSIFCLLGSMLALLWVVWGGELWAAPSLETQREAQRLSQAGAEAYQAGDFLEALEAYQEANRLVPHPVLDVNIGRVYEALNQPEQALIHCKIVLNAPGVPSSVRAAAEECVDRVAKGLQSPELEVLTVPPGAVLLVDGREQGVTPWVGPVAPGRRVLDVSLDGFAHETRSVVVERGQKFQVRVELRPGDRGALTLESLPAGAELWIDDQLVGGTPVTAWALDAGQHQLELRADGYEPMRLPVTIETDKTAELSVSLVPLDWDPESRAMWPAWSLFGVAAASLAGGIWLGVAAKDARDEANRIANRAQSPAERSDYNTSRDEYRRFSLGADALFVVSGAALTAGLLWWLWPED